MLALLYAFMINSIPFLSELSSVVELHLAKVDVEGSNPLARSNFGSIAQLVEQLTLNQWVVGSNPPTPTIFADASAGIGCRQQAYFWASLAQW